MFAFEMTNSSSISQLVISNLQHLVSKLTAFSIQNSAADPAVDISALWNNH